jgi:hypothetical protein
LDDPKVRQLFTRDHLLASAWYALRLKAKQAIDSKLCRRHLEYLSKFMKRASYAAESARLDLPGRLTRVRSTLAQVESDSYLETLSGTLGAEPIDGYTIHPKL